MIMGQYTGRRVNLLINLESGRTIFVKRCPIHVAESLAQTIGSSPSQGVITFGSSLNRVTVPYQRIEFIQILDANSVLPNMVFDLTIEAE